MFEDHVTQIDLDLSLFIVKVKPVVLLLDSLRPQHLCLSLLTELLEEFVVEFFLAPVSLRGECEDRTGETSAVRLGPPEYFLLYHLEQTFSVHRAYVNFGLKSSDFVGPWHGFTC